jgi:cytochrome c oxidase cbb3-type subunit 3
MSRRARLIAVYVLAGIWATSVVMAQGPAAAPAGGGQPVGGRGEAQGPGGRGNARGGFTTFTRELASPEVLIRGKLLYDANCASCHAPDLRGSADGKNPNLLRSGLALRDAQGELIGSKIAAHAPAITLVPNDSTAIARYIHSALAARGGRGLPASELNVLVGDAKAGEVYFGTACSSCHSPSGDLKGVASKYKEPRALQNAWVSGSSTVFGGFGGGGGRGAVGVGNPATVTMADGTTVKGTLVRKDAFLVVITTPDGTRRSYARKDGVPKVDVVDPAAGHKAMLLKLAFDDPDNSKLHNVTAYLWTLK